MSQLRDLNKSKPRSKADESLVSEITRLESAITLANDDLVMSNRRMLLECYLLECFKTVITSRLSGVTDENNHLKEQLKKQLPELQAVCVLAHLILLWRIRYL